MHSNVSNIGTVYTVDGFLHSFQKLQCYSSLLSLEHIALSIHIGQPEPGGFDFKLLYFNHGLIKSGEIYPAYKKISKRCGKSDSG